MGWSSGAARLSCDICFGSRRLTSGCRWHWSHLRLTSSSGLTDDRQSSVPSPAFRVAPSSHLQTSNSSSYPACASDLLDFPFPLLSPARESLLLRAPVIPSGPPHKSGGLPCFILRSADHICEEPVAAFDMFTCFLESRWLGARARTRLPSLKPSTCAY